ncbi:hypothetical protein LguiA_023905 [Lonicera macranthoides]
MFDLKFRVHFIRAISATCTGVFDFGMENRVADAAAHSILTKGLAKTAEQSKNRSIDRFGWFRNLAGK